MRFTAALSPLLLALLATIAAAQDERPSHYGQGRSIYAESGEPKASEYVFPDRRSSPVSQAAYSAPAEPLAVSRQPNDKAHAPIPLAPRGGNAGTAGSTSPRSKSLGASQAITTVGGSLVVVLGLFLLFAWLLRKHLPASATALPKEAVELLGRTPLQGRQQLSLLRIGNKLVLLAVSPLGVETLTEITDPAEVDRLVGLCRSERPGSVTASFRQALTDAAGERVSGFLGSEERPRRRASA